MSQYTVNDRYQAADVMREIANEFGLPVHIWQVEDLYSQITDDFPDHLLTDEEVDAIVDLAVKSPEWTHYLERITDEEWETVRSAISESIDALGIDRDRLE